MYYEESSNITKKKNMDSVDQQAQVLPLNWFTESL